MSIISTEFTSHSSTFSRKNALVKLQKERIDNFDQKCNKSSKCCFCCRNVVFVAKIVQKSKVLNFHKKIDDFEISPKFHCSGPKMLVFFFSAFVVNFKNGVIFMQIFSRISLFITFEEFPLVNLRRKFLPVKELAILSKILLHFWININGITLYLPPFFVKRKVFMRI